MIDCGDKCVPLEVLSNIIAWKVVEILTEVQSLPEYISQRKAYEKFGRGDVQRWLKEGLIEYRKTPGKNEFKVMELRKLKDNPQDYFHTKKTK